MLIEDPDKFKTWLTAKLEPLCDADPAALAKYVYALVKKDRPIEELKTSMRDQLEVFLQRETETFVEALFANLEISDTPSNDDASKQPEQKKEDEVSTKPPPTETKPEPHTSSEPDLREVLNAAHRDNQIKKETLPKEPDKDEKPRPSGPRRRRPSPSLSPEVRRGRSPYDRRRSRSRSRERDRSARWRNKSPPRRHDLRRRSFTKSPIRRISRSPPPKRSGRYRNRSPPPRSLSHSRSPFSPSHSIDRDGKASPDPLQRDIDLGLPVSLSSSHHASRNEPNQPRRCRDYDEKGFCMRGDLCPFDHGSDPVILEDIPRGGLFNGASALGVGVSNPILSASQLLQNASPSRLEYNPTSNLNIDHRFNWRRFPRTPHHLRGMSRGLRVGSISSNLPKRELISVVTSETGQSNNGSLMNTNLQFRGSCETDLALREKPRYEPYNMGNRRVLRVSPSVPGNCTLQLKKVPVHQNNITQLNNHFSKFGKIVKILVGYENDAEAALVTFSSHSEATSAYKSTEAVLNNRFIKVFWHNPNTINNENKPENMETIVRPTALERLGSPAPKEPVKMSIELRKRKQSLLEKQINHQKLLIQRIEAGNVKPDQKTSIMDAIKSLQESIENLKKEVSEEIMSSSNSFVCKVKVRDPSLSVRKSKEETQRQLLDAELDLLKQEQQGGGNLVEIKKRISELKMKAYKQKIPISKASSFFRGSYRGRGATSARGRSAPPSRYTYNADYNVVDHRPTKLLVSGYEEDDKDDVLSHFNQFGEIINYTSDDATPSLILNYKSRKEAEVAMQKGRNFQDRLLSVTWATPNHNIRPGVTTQNTPVPYNPPKDDNNKLPATETATATEDDFPMSPSLTPAQDEEEEENEDRAWRR